MTGPRLALQDRTDAELRALLERPGHAYLFVGPSGSGKLGAAREFAAALLCERGGCGECASCAAAEVGSHPDLVLIERSGPALTMEEVRSATALALRAPVGGRRQVIVLRDVHLGRQVMPALLKTVEEPPASTVFLLLADGAGPELATLASRCAVVHFERLGVDWLTSTLTAEGVPPDRAELAAAASGGSLVRARLLATDDELALRRDVWMSVAGRLDSTGCTVASLVSELTELTDRAMQPLRSRHGDQLRHHAEQVKQFGSEAVVPKKLLVEQQRREERRARTEELQAGLAALAESFRLRLTSGDRTDAPRPHTAESVRGAAACIERAGRSLVRNPNETLLLQSVLVRLQQYV